MRLSLPHRIGLIQRGSSYHLLQLFRSLQYWELNLHLQCALQELCHWAISPALSTFSVEMLRQGFTDCLDCFNCLCCLVGFEFVVFLTYLGLRAKCNRLGFNDLILNVDGAANVKGSSLAWKINEYQEVSNLFGKINDKIHSWIRYFMSVSQDPDLVKQKLEGFVFFLFFSGAEDWT